MQAANEVADGEEQLQNQVAREVVTYGWIALIVLSTVATLAWILGVDSIPDSMGIFAAGWMAASFTNIGTLILSRILR